MKKLLFVALILGFGYWYVNGFFEQNKVARFVKQYHADMFSEKSDFCDIYTDDYRESGVMLIPGRQQLIQRSSTKSEACFGREKLAQIFAKEQIVFHNEIEDLKIEKDGFFGADISYTLAMKMNQRSLTLVEFILHNKLRLEHSLFGELKIASLQSDVQLVR